MLCHRASFHWHRDSRHGCFLFVSLRYGCFLFVSLIELVITWVFINSHFTIKAATVIINKQQQPGIFGPSEDRHYTCEGVEELVVSLRTPIYLAVLLCGILFSTSVLSRRPRGDPIRGMALGLTAGTLSGNMFCVKLLIELLQISYNTSWESVWGTWLPYPLLIGAAFFAISNLFFLTKGMREYQALFMVTVFEGAGMVTNAVSASVILRELDYMEWWRVLLYAFGLCTICFGMFVLCRSEFRVVKEDDIDFTPGEGIQGVDDINVTPGQGEDAKGLGPGAGVEASNLEEQAQIGNGSKSKKGPGACFCFAKAF
ncbi:unnamed protein product [Polarella glacialis]|uniref:Uncharacterized protein n=1 Tax=Polarella glacialis TaxID=89957 RepID=A0A813KRK4_POLGL|nr:unnamed protein product [Polarella glacialis]